MSENLTENTNVTDAEAAEAEATPALSLRERLAERLHAVMAEVTDGTRISDEEAVLTETEEMVAEAEEAVAIQGRLTDVLKRIARISAFLRIHFLTVGGVPAWNAEENAAFKAFVEGTLTETFGALDKRDRSRLTSAIRQHVARTYRQMAIEAYVASFTNTDGELRYPDILDEDGTVNPTKDGYEAFKYEVRKQYLDAGLKVPSTYQTQADKENTGDGGDGNNGGNDPLSVLNRGMAVVTEGKIRDDYAAASLLEMASTFVLTIANPQRDGGIRGREAVAEFLFRLSEVAAFGAKAAESMATSKDREAVAPYLWNAEEDKGKLATDAS